jgi:hypothetical protein
MRLAQLALTKNVRLQRKGYSFQEDSALSVLTNVQNCQPVEVLFFSHRPQQATYAYWQTGVAGPTKQVLHLLT